MTKTTRTYSDIDLNFDMHPITGDIGAIYNETSVKRALRNLVLMVPYDCPFHPEISGNIRNLLFELLTPDTSIILKTTLTKLVSYYEPRVNIISIDIAQDDDRHGVEIIITFSIADSSIPIELSVTLTRVR